MQSPKELHRLWAKSCRDAENVDQRIGHRWSAQGLCAVARKAQSALARRSGKRVALGLLPKPDHCARRNWEGRFFKEVAGLLGDVLLAITRRNQTFLSILVIMIRSRT